MISVNTLVFIISAFCAFKDPSVSMDKKESCAEFMTNCVIIADGKIPNKQVDICRERWADERIRASYGY